GRSACLPPGAPSPCFGSSSLKGKASEACTKIVPSHQGQRAQNHILRDPWNRRISKPSRFRGRLCYRFCFGGESGVFGRCWPYGRQGANSVGKVLNDGSICPGPRLGHPFGQTIGASY